VLVLLLLVGVAACGDDRPRAASPTTTSTVPRATSTTTDSTVAPTTVVAKDRKCATAPQQDITPPPADWATYWQTQPDPNRPVSLEICLDDVAPTVGQPVTLTVTADDPDASIGEGNCDIAVSWVSSPGTDCRDFQAAPGSPEPTPSKVHGHVVKTYTYSYTKAQTYLVFVTAWSSPESSKPHPYASDAQASLHVSVSL
jgi:hypothetical protein